MKIAIDFTAFIPQMTGVDTYLRQLILHLARIDGDNEYIIYRNAADRQVFEGALPGNFSHTTLSARPRPIRLFSQQFLLPLFSSLWQADVVHSPSFISPYLRGTARHVLTVHDMTSFSHPDCHIALRRSASYRYMVLSSLRRADVVAVPSSATRQAILDVLPELEAERIHVTALGIGDEFQILDPEQVQRVAARLQLPGSYILYVGTIEPRKNLPALLESYRQLVAAGDVQEHLVLAGKLGWGYESLLKQLDHPALRGRVHLAGYVDPQDLPAVYAGARLFVYPSLFEGFGLPPLEAMACGAPVVSTRTSSLTENLEGAAELVAPDDTAALTDAMRRLLTDPAHWAMRRTQGLERAGRYRWEHTARQTLECYRAACRP